MSLILYVFLTCCIALAYSALIIYILEKWTETTLSASEPEIHQDFSIIIPARNEESNIEVCIESILKSAHQYRGSVELIVIDDHSEDSTFTKASQFKSETTKVFSLSEVSEEIFNAQKKAALNFGLRNATHDFIVQFDADIQVDQNYFFTLNKFIQKEKPEFIAGPVYFYPSSGLLEHFQTLDMMGMMAVTNAGIKTGNWFMANGANMAYRKSETNFDEKGLASGDDVFKIQAQAKKDKNEIHFLNHKDIIVNTQPETTWKALYNQRIRWATKNKLMQSKKMQLMMAIPFMNAWLLLIHFALFFIFGLNAMVLLLFHMALKLSVDYIYLKKLNNFFNEKGSLKYFFLSNMLHVLYLALVGTMSLFVNKYEWKGRRVV